MGGRRRPGDHPSSFIANASCSASLLAVRGSSRLRADRSRIPGRRPGGTASRSPPASGSASAGSCSCSARGRAPRLSSTGRPSRCRPCYQRARARCRSRRRAESPLRLRRPSARSTNPGLRPGRSRSRGPDRRPASGRSIASSRCRSARPRSRSCCSTARRHRRRPCERTRTGALTLDGLSWRANASASAFCSLSASCPATWR